MSSQRHLNRPQPEAGGDILKTGGKDDLVKNKVISVLSNTESRFPDWKGYEKVFHKRGNDKRFEDFFQQITKEKESIITGGQKLWLFKPPIDRMYIVAGDHRGSNNKDSGYKDYTYITGKVLAKQAGMRGVKLFQDTGTLKRFLEQFPGNTTSEKILSLVTLLELPLTGYYTPGSQYWENVNEIGYLMVVPANTQGICYVLRRDGKNGTIHSSNRRNACPALVWKEIVV